MPARFNLAGIFSMQDIQEDQYESLLAEKTRRIESQFKQFGIPDIQVFASQPKHFRLRAEFKVWHEGDRCFHAMFERGTKNGPIEITNFPIASKAIAQLMPKLIAEINQSVELKHRLFQLEYLNTLSGDMLVTLIYHRQLNDTWIAEAKRIKEKFGIHIIGRAKKMRLLLDQDHVIETLHVDGKALKYKQIEGGFTQPNGEMNQNMLSWARNCADNKESDLLELYCGNGNFSIALADKFNRVFATEISKTSVKAAFDNKAMNQLENIDFARVSAEEFTSHMNGTRKRRRLKDSKLEEADFQTVLVDPPRSGLDIESCKMISSYQNIIYISCNPDTLEENLAELCQSHTITHFALFDQFPYTHHIECGIYLTKKL
jgi:tRNA (uracil-5-)-methyltransferase